MHIFESCGLPLCSSYFPVISLDFPSKIPGHMVHVIASRQNHWKHLRFYHEILWMVAKSCTSSMVYALTIPLYTVFRAYLTVANECRISQPSTADQVTTRTRLATRGRPAWRPWRYLCYPPPPVPSLDDHVSPGIQPATWWENMGVYICL